MIQATASLNGSDKVMDGALVTTASLFIQTIIFNQKRTTVGFMQIYVLVWWTGENIGAISEEYHLQDGKG